MPTISSLEAPLRGIAEKQGVMLSLMSSESRV